MQIPKTWENAVFEFGNLGKHRFWSFEFGVDQLFFIWFEQTKFRWANEDTWASHSTQEKNFVSF